MPPNRARSTQDAPPSESIGIIGCANAPCARCRYGEMPVPSSMCGEATEDSETSNCETPSPVVNEPIGLEPADRPLPATAWNW